MRSDARRTESGPRARRRGLRPRSRTSVCLHTSRGDASGEPAGRRTSVRCPARPRPVPTSDERQARRGFPPNLGRPPSDSLDGSPGRRAQPRAVAPPRHRPPQSTAGNTYRRVPSRARARRAPGRRSPSASPRPPRPIGRPTRRRGLPSRNAGRDPDRRPEIRRSATASAQPHDTSRTCKPVFTRRMRLIMASIAAAVTPAAARALVQVRRLQTARASARGARPALGRLAHPTEAAIRNRGSPSALFAGGRSHLSKSRPECPPCRRVPRWWPLRRRLPAMASKSGEH
jgi:hypothetical protein